MFRSDGEDLIVKLDFFLGLSHAGPIFVDRGAASQGFVERRDLISGIVGVQRGGCLRVAASPCASIRGQPMIEGFSIHVCLVGYYTSEGPIRLARELPDRRTRCLRKRDCPGEISGFAPCL